MARDHTPLARPSCRELSPAPVFRQHSRTSQLPPASPVARCPSPGGCVTTVSSCHQNVYGYSMNLPNPTTQASGHVKLEASWNGCSMTLPNPITQASGHMTPNGYSMTLPNPTTQASGHMTPNGYSMILPNSTMQASGHVKLETSSNVATTPQRSLSTHRPPSIIRSPSIAGSFDHISATSPVRRLCTEGSPKIRSRRVDVPVPVPLKHVSTASVLRGNKVTGAHPIHSREARVITTSDASIPSAQNLQVRKCISPNRTTTTSEDDRRQSSRIAEEDIEKVSPQLTPRSCGTLPPDRPLTEEEAVVVAEATAKALSLTALQQALARVEKLEEGLSEERKRTKVLSERCEAETTRGLELEEKLKVEVNRNEELMAKCVAESARVKQMEKELLAAHQLNEQLKSPCAEHEGKLDCVRKDCIALQSKVMKLSSDNDNLTSIINKVLRQSDLTSEDIVGLAQSQDVNWPSTKVFVDGELTIGHEDTDICP